MTEPAVPDQPDVPDGQPLDPAQAIAQYFLSGPVKDTGELSYLMVKHIRKSQQRDRDEQS